MAEYQEALQQARSLMNARNYREAFVALRPVLRYPGMVQQTHELFKALALLANIGAGIAGKEFAAIVRKAVKKPGDAEALYNLGYELIEQNLSDIAATVLAYAHGLFPDDPHILSELCSALESNMRYAEARRFLLAVPALVQQSFVCCYLLAFNALMSGDLETPRRVLPDLRRMQSEDERYGLMAARIADMLGRADALSGHTPLDEHDLRGWHLVITAGFLLHLSPYGLDAGMNGRYAFVQDSQARCLEGIRKIQALLGELQLAVPRVFALPDRDSQILAIATAQVLGLPLETWPAEGSDAQGLIVAYDLGALNGDMLSTLDLHRPGQILWSHAACWISDQPIAADLTTFLYQVNHAPWGERMRADPETREVTTLPPDEREPAVLGAELAAATLEEGSLDDLPALLGLARVASRERIAALFQVSGSRERQWAGSPVPSNYFH